MDGQSRLRGGYEATADQDRGAPLELVDDAGHRHLLQGRFVPDGTLVEALTHDGWLPGHYRSADGAKSRAIVFEMEVCSGPNQHETITVYLPGGTLFRWPA